MAISQSVSKAVSQSPKTFTLLRLSYRSLPSAHFCSCCRCCSRSLWSFCSFCVLCIISNNCFNLHNSKQYQNWGRHQQKPERSTPTGLPGDTLSIKSFSMVWVITRTVKTKDSFSLRNAAIFNNNANRTESRNFIRCEHKFKLELAAVVRDDEDSASMHCLLDSSVAEIAFCI